MLLVMKNIWNSGNSVCKIMSHVCKIVLKKCLSVVPMLFGSIGKTLCNLLKVILWTRDNVFCGFPDSPLWYGHYIQAVIMFQGFFLQPTQRASLYYFRRIYTMWLLPHLFCCHDLLIFQKFCECLDHTF